MYKCESFTRKCLYLPTNRGTLKIKPLRYKVRSFCWENIIENNEHMFFIVFFKKFWKKPSTIVKPIK